MAQPAAVRIVEVGPRDLAAGSVTLVRRVAGGKSAAPVGGVLSAVSRALDDDHEALYAAALAHREANTAAVDTVEIIARTLDVRW